MWPFNRKSYEQVNKPIDNLLLEALYKYTSHSGYAVTMNDDPQSYIEQGYSGNTDVYSIINRILRMASQARLALWKIEGGKWVEVTDHELVKFIRQANPVMKMSEFIEGHLIYKLAVGNSYWYKPALKEGVNKGKTIELWLLPANDVQILAGASWTNPVGGYQLASNITVKFAVEEVYHSKFFNPLFGRGGDLYGQSPLKAAAETVSKQNQAEITELKQFENQSPPFLLYRDTDNLMNQLSSEQRKEIQKAMREFAQKRKGEGYILPEKFAKIDLGISPTDLNILQSTQEGRRVLCNVYGMPKELMGDISGSTYNNIIEAKKDAWNNCVIPNLTDLAGNLTSFLIDPVSEYKGLFFAFDYTTVAELQKDLAQAVAWMKSAYWTINEIREATGVKPVDDPAANEVLIGMAETPLSSLSEPVDPPPLKNLGDYK